jgi:uncharacterized protein (DUF1501 family)
MNPFSRRDLLKNSAALAALGAIGWRPGMARAAQGERKFIFFWAGGAWDTTTVFDPHHSSDYITMDDDTYSRTLGGVTHTAGDDRPSVSRFFERWGHQAAVINGIDAKSVGHDSGTKLTLTGTSASSYADWPTTLAAMGQGEYPLPNLVFSGPSYPGTYGSAVVRAGGGTLLELIDGSITGSADSEAPSFETPADSMIDAFVHSRVTQFSEANDAIAGQTRERSQALLESMERTMELEGRRFEAGLTDLGSGLLAQSIKAAEMMRLGISRTAMISIPGGWDCHGDVTVNAGQFEDFFGALDQLMDYLQNTPGLHTRWLADEVVVVCMSEFGRTPMVNGGGGKDHWPYNSAMVVGAGVNGGQNIGASDDGLIGLPIDFQTGRQSDTGQMLGSENLGVALLKLGGLDPEKILPGIEPLEALIK